MNKLRFELLDILVNEKFKTPLSCFRKDHEVYQYNLEVIGKKLYSLFFYNKTTGELKLWSRLMKNVPSEEADSLLQKHLYIVQFKEGGTWYE